MTLYDSLQILDTISSFLTMRIKEGPYKQKKKKPLV